MNARATHPRMGGENFADLISRTARNASASSPVEFEITVVPVTTPLVFTLASTTTSPCAPLSEKASVGVSVNAKSESAGQPPLVLFPGGAFFPPDTNRAATHPVSPLDSRTFTQLSSSRRTDSASPRFTCRTTSASVEASARTFSAEAVTRTVPMTRSSAGVETGGGGGAASGGAPGGGAEAQRMSKKRTVASEKRRMSEG